MANGRVQLPVSISAFVDKSLKRRFMCVSEKVFAILKSILLPCPDNGFGRSKPPTT